MVTGLPEDISWYVDELPVAPTLVELCKTDSGRMKIIEKLDTLTRYDLFLAWGGDTVNRFSNSPAFEEYLLTEWADGQCGETFGYVFPIKPEYSFYYFTGFPGQPKSIYCISANSGGGHEDDCHLEYFLKLEPGWQACKLLYDKRQRRHGKLTIEPTFWTEDDIISPPRFAGYKIKIEGHGDEMNSSYVYLSNVRILALRDDMMNDQRERYGCEMPRRVVPPRAPATSPTVSSPPKWYVALENKRDGGQKADFIMYNYGGSKGRMYYRVDVYDGDERKWEKFQEGYADVEKNTRYTQQLHKWGAKDYQIVYTREGKL